MAVNPLACCVMLATFGQVSGGAPPHVEADADRKRLLDQFAADAARYQVTIHTGQPKALDLLPEAVLNWHGSAFVWLKDGRPEVIGAQWQTVNARSGQTERGHAFHSLSDHPITARLDSQLVWSPKEGGVKFQSVDGAEPPAGDSQRRLEQLRALSRQFSAVLWKGGRSQLRMLTQPIHRYEPASGPVKDGAIFAFTNTEFGTDPDALLLLEARHASDGPRWEFAFARFHYAEMSGNHRDQEVWRVEDTWTQRKQHVFGAGPGRDSAYYSVLRP
jgi:hypothetical protein